MRLIENLKGWFERDIRLVTWRDVETVVDQPDVAEVRFSTKKGTYTVTADTNHGESFLGGTFVEQTRRREQELPDGTCSEKTWREIVEAITDNEVGPIKPPTPKPPKGRLF